MGAVSPDSAHARSRSHRSPNARLAWRVVAALAAVGGLATACAELTPPEAYTAPTSTTVAAGAEIQIDSQVAERPGADPGVDEFVPTPDPGYVPTLLVSASPSILAADGARSAPLAGPLADVRATRTVDDLSGGLVVQELDGPVVYWPAQGERELLDEAGGRLLDVGYWDGSPRAFVDRGDGQVDWIRLASTEQDTERERQVHFLLDEGMEIVAFAASRDLQAVIVQDDQCGELRFYGADGQRLDLQGPDQPECTFPGRPALGSVALSPDGDAVVYTVVTYRGDGTEAATELVARELIGGSEGFLTRPIGEDLDLVTSLSYDGDRVAYLRESAEQDAVTILDITSGLEVPVDLLEATDVYSVSFARIPVEPAE